MPSPDPAKPGSPAPARSQNLNAETLALAWPMVLSNTSEQLLGLVDTAIIGNLGSAALLGAIAMGTVLFSFLFWAFGFLRMGTTGLTAQAAGAGDGLEAKATLGRALLIAGAASVLLIALQGPLAWGAFALFQGSDEVEAAARTYFDIRIWAAPFTLANYAIAGLLIGLGRTRFALYHQLALNLTNAALSALFVLGFGLGVAGVAAGTVLASLVAFAAGLWLARRALVDSELEGVAQPLTRAILLAPEKLQRALNVNRDIMIRTLLLLVVFTFFMNQGAAQGDVILAANAILMQFISFAALFLDGFAFAGEVFVGRAVGAKDRESLRAAAMRTTQWAVGVAALLSVGFAVAGPPVIDFLTNVPAVREAARAYLPWVVLGPLAGVWAFQLDGIFIGATRTRAMRNAAFESTVVFLAAYFVLTPFFGNHGQWGALMVYYAARLASLALRYPALEAATATRFLGDRGLERDRAGLGAGAKGPASAPTASDTEE